MSSAETRPNPAASRSEAWYASMYRGRPLSPSRGGSPGGPGLPRPSPPCWPCLLYTSDAADDM
eukprot:505571-Alexandrium_andersonii.AAC.1